MKLYTELIYKEKLDDYLVFEEIKKILPYYEEDFEDDKTVVTLKKDEYEKCLTVLDDSFFSYEYLEKILNIKKHYIVVQTKDCTISEIMNDYCSFDIMHEENHTQLYLYKKDKLSENRDDEFKSIDCKVVADFSFLPDAKQLYIEDIALNGIVVDNDFDYLAMYSYLRERNCNNDNMKLLELLYHINMYTYGDKHLLGMSKECVEYATEYIHDKRLLRLIKKGISITEKVDKKVSSNSSVKGKYNEKLHKAWLKYKKKDEVKIMLHNLMKWFVDYNKYYIIEHNKKSLVINNDFVEKITTHRLDDEAVNADLYIKGKGYDGEFPIYYKNENSCTKYIECNFIKNSDDRPGIIGTQTSIGIINNNEKYLKQYEPEFFDCIIGGVEVEIGGVEKKKCNQLGSNDIKQMQEYLIDVSLSMFKDNRTKQTDNESDYSLYNMSVTSSMKLSIGVILVIGGLYVGLNIVRIITKLIICTLVYLIKGNVNFSKVTDIFIGNGITFGALIVFLPILCLTDALIEKNKLKKKIKHIKKIYKNS